MWLTWIQSPGAPAGMIFENRTRGPEHEYICGLHSKTNNNLASTAYKCLGNMSPFCKNLWVIILQSLSQFWPSRTAGTSYTSHLLLESCILCNFYISTHPHPPHSEEDSGVHIQSCFFFLTNINIICFTRMFLSVFFFFVSLAIRFTMRCSAQLSRPVSRAHAHIRLYLVSWEDLNENWWLFATLNIAEWRKTKAKGKKRPALLRLWFSQHKNPDLCQALC